MFGFRFVITSRPLRKPLRAFALKSHLGVEPQSNSDLNAKGRKGFRKGREDPPRWPPIHNCSATETEPSLTVGLLPRIARVASSRNTSTPDPGLRETPHPGLYSITRFASSEHSLRGCETRFASSETRFAVPSTHFASSEHSLREFRALASRFRALTSRFRALTSRLRKWLREFRALALRVRDLALI